MQPIHYGAELARIHHEHFGRVARAAASELTKRLARRGIASGTIVDLAAGSGILARSMTDAGFDVWGVDISEDMLRIARAEAPGASFVQGSLWEVSLPPCVAVSAIGEAFSYATDPTAGLPALERRLSEIHRALVGDGIFLFDVAGPGRSGPTGSRRTFWSNVATGSYLGVEEREEGPRRGLTRAITMFVPQGNLYRRIEEMHQLELYPPDQIEAVLKRAGFAWEPLPHYGDLGPLPGWHAYATYKTR
jgi:SAM-dependent methyltransferase